MPISDSLLSAWPFPESGGTTTADLGPANNTGTLVGSAALAGGLLDLPSAGSCVDVSSFTLSGSWTIAFRGKQDVSGGAGKICGNRGGVTSWINFEGAISGDLHVLVNAAVDRYDFAGMFPFTTITDYAVVYDSVADTMSVYKDGVLNETKTSITSATFIFSAIGSGITGDGGSLVGELDYVYVWERAITALEAAAVDANPDSVLTVATPVPVFMHHYMQQGIL